MKNQTYKRTDEQLAKLRAYHKTRALPTETRKCEHCGTPFICPVKSDRRYCCQKCANRYTALRIPRETRYCLRCNSSFVVRATSTKKYCSSKCSSANAREKRTHFPTDYDIREKISKTVAESYIRGKFNPFWFYKQEWVKSERFGKEIYSRSSYETKAIHILESLEGVVDVGHEKIRIPYIGMEGFVRNFVPDFLIQTESKPIILEIKSNDFVDEEGNQLKYKAARKYAKKNKMEFLIWTEDFLFSTNNGSTTESLQEIVKATATTLRKGKVMVQSGLRSNAKKKAEMTFSPMENIYV
jgi:hypothetical protein